MGRKRLDQMGEYVPQLRARVLIEGGGHWIRQERQDEVNAALLHFLEQQFPARSCGD